MEVNDEIHTSIPLSRNPLGGMLIGLKSQSYSVENGKSYQVCGRKASRCICWAHEVGEWQSET